MRIGQSNSMSASSIYVRAKSIGGVYLPDFSDFHYNTKPAPSMSDDKFKEKIVEQAEKDNKAGKFQAQSFNRLPER